MGTDNHEHDSHYHGEPSRVLDDKSLPDTVLLYRGGFPELNGSPSREPDSNQYEYWANKLSNLQEIKNLLLPSSAPTVSDLNVISESIHSTEPFGSEFENFPEVTYKTGLLFLPLRLQISEACWDDFRANDVSVNWLSIDPSSNQDRFPGVILLSDWITEVSYQIPDSRTTGDFPGVFQISSDSIPKIEKCFRNTNGITEALSLFLDNEENKIRPGFLHDRDWNYPER